MKRIAFFFIIVFAFKGNASTIKSICNGNWSSPIIWNTATIPVSTDTVIIYNSVILDINVTLTGPGMLIIESSGSLCGNNNFDGQFLTNGPLSVNVLTTQGNSISNAWVSAEESIINVWTINGDACLSGCAPSCSVSINNCQQETSIETLFNSTNSILQIYPNPNNGSFIIEPSNLTKQTMQVYDVNDKLVLSQTIEGKTTIDANTLNEGIYNIRFISSEGVLNKRVVIVR